MRLGAALPYVGVFLLTLNLAGCHVDTHKNGKSDDVEVDTPFGAVRVKTHNTAMAQLGLTPYPGATVVHKNEHDENAADVSLSFGSSKLGVHVLELETGDSQAKVLEFYRKDMSRYGAVITCKASQTVGQPVRTAEGLGCDTDGHNSHDDEVELRTGSPQHQHIVSVKARDRSTPLGGTQVGLIALDLPKGLGQHRDGEREE